MLQRVMGSQRVNDTLAAARTDRPRDVNTPKNTHSQTDDKLKVTLQYVMSSQRVN